MTLKRSTYGSTHTHEYSVACLFIQLGQDQCTLLVLFPPFDVWKVEGNQSHFLHSGQCRLWFPWAGGATLAIKYCWACKVWEVYGAPGFAKNNRGKCWSKVPKTGRGKVVQTLSLRSEDLHIFSILWASAYKSKLFSFFNKNHKLTHNKSFTSEDEESLCKTQLELLKFYTTESFLVIKIRFSFLI